MSTMYGRSMTAAVAEGNKTELPPRAAKSLQIHDRTRVRMNIVKPSDLKGPGTDPAARNENEHQDRTFGGIDRRVRPRRATMKQTQKFANFAKSFRADPVQDDVYVVAFVNSKSGGQAGGMIMSLLQDSLSKEGKEGKILGEVCDLSAKGEPDGTIASLAKLLRRKDLDLRLLVCGGDGTVTWILTAIEGCKALDGLQDRCPVGIAPLGTGNDLARSLGWGGRMGNVADILNYIQWVAEATPVRMDQWSLVLRPHGTVPKDHKLRSCGSHPQSVRDEVARKSLLENLKVAIEKDDLDPKSELFLGFWQNYYSIGTDAKIATGVDIARNSTWLGQKMFRLGLGKVCYAWQFLKSGVVSKFVTPAISDFKALETYGPTPEGSDMMPDDIDPPLLERKVCGAPGGTMQLMLVNINSYGAGMKCQPAEAQARYKPSPSDGTFEVLGLRNAGCQAGMYAGIKGPTHMLSASCMGFTVAGGEYMQQDGEPWKLEQACDVLIEPHRKVMMLRAPSKAHWRGHIDPAFWDS